MSDRKVVLKMVMSLDGFVTSPDGTHEWMFEFFGVDSGDWNRRGLDEAGVHAMGRRSYEIMGPHWAASEGPIATSMNEKPKAVFSRTLEKAEWGPVEIFGGGLGSEIAGVTSCAGTWAGRSGSSRLGENKGRCWSPAVPASPSRLPAWALSTSTS